MIVQGISRPLLLDLFCGAGGAGSGYNNAGFKVIGVDIEPQPHNLHTFYQDDALHVLDTFLAGKEWHGYHLRDFSAIHASPPCKHVPDFYNAVGRHIFGYGKYTSGKIYQDKDGRTRKREGEYRLEVGLLAMGIDWKMSLAELSQAIPPAYTRFIGSLLLAAISTRLEVVA